MDVVLTTPLDCVLIAFKQFSNGVVFKPSQSNLCSQGMFENNPAVDYAINDNLKMFDQQSK